MSCIGRVSAGQGIPMSVATTSNGTMVLLTQPRIIFFSYFALAKSSLDMGLVSKWINLTQIFFFRAVATSLMKRRRREQIAQKI